MYVLVHMESMGTRRSTGHLGIVLIQTYILSHVMETPQRFVPRAILSSTGRDGSVWSKAATITNCAVNAGGDEMS